MTLSTSLCRGTVMLLFALAVGGCLPPAHTQLDEEKEPHFLEGKRRGHLPLRTVPGTASPLGLRGSGHTTHRGLQAGTGPDNFARSSYPEFAARIRATGGGQQAFARGNRALARLRRPPADADQSTSRC